MERFAWQFEDDDTVRVPGVLREWTTPRILTTEYVDGIKASDVDRLDQEGYDRKEIVRRGFDAVMKQVFVHGFFHADPHPGNLFVLPDNVVCFLDFGMTGRIDRHARDALADLMAGIARRNETRVADSLIRLTRSDADVDVRALQMDVQEFMDQNVYRPLKDLNLEKLLSQSIDIAARHHLAIPRDLFLMIKALTVIEGVGRVLDPDFNAVERAGKIIRAIHLTRLNPRHMASDMMESATETIHLLKGVPAELREFLKMARRGDLKIAYEHRGLEPMLATHDRISNRIAYALVLSALIIGSALMVLSGVPPLWREIPIIGLAGFIAAGFMGFWLLASILRRGRM
jgi:ubiquinone biosynthesis protein